MDELKHVPEVYNILNNKVKDEADDDIFDRTGESGNVKLDIDLDDNSENKTNEKLEKVEDFDWDDI